MNPPSHKWKAPPVDPNNSEAIWLARVADHKKQQLIEAASKNGQSSMPITATVDKPRVESVREMQATSLEDVKDIDNIQSSHRAKPSSPYIVLELSEGEDEIDELECEKPAKSAEAELSKCQIFL
jgi:hypothetical protein